MKNRISIAIVIISLISKNGVAKQAIELAKDLRKRGHTVKFFTYAFLPDGTFPEYREFDIHYCVNINKSVIYKFVKNHAKLEQIFWYFALLDIRRFRNLFKNKYIDILNPHDWFGLWLLPPIKANRKIVAVINDVPQRLGTIIDKLKLTQDKKNAPFVDKILVLDEMNKEKVHDWIQVDKEKIRVVRSGIDIGKYKNFNESYDLYQEFSLNKDAVLIGCANLLARNRRYEDVLFALKDLNKIQNKFRLFIFSKLDFDSQYAEELKQIVSKFRLEHTVHFIDKFFTDQERMKYLKSIDILIFPNSPQTWGLTVIEAMALGTPVIVSTGSGVSEVIENNVTGLIFQQRDVSDLTKKILLLADKSLRKKIAGKGKKFVLESFSWEKFGNQVEKEFFKTIV